MSSFLMYYVTEVENNHVLNVNGKNVTVEVHAKTSNMPRRYEYRGVKVDTEFNVHSYDIPFTTVLVAVELARECMRQEAKEASAKNA